MPSVAEPEFLTWESPGAPARVHIALNVVEKLRAAALASPVEVGGLLLGSPVSGGEEIQITGFRTLPRPERPDRRFTVSPADDPLIKTGVSAAREQFSVAGFYRTHRRGGLSPDEHDAAFFRAHFSPSSTFLLIRPDTDRLCSADFFGWSDGHLESTSGGAAFPLEAGSLRRREQAAPPILPTERPKSKTFRRVWILSAFPAFAILLLAAGLFLRPAVKPPTLKIPAPAPIPLGLQVESRKGQLLVRWNRENPHVQTARSGLLTIADGVHPVETIPLNTRQLQAGMVLYVPSGERMQFRLDVDAGQEISDTVVAFPVLPAAPRVTRAPRRK